MDDGWRPPTVWRWGPFALGRSNDGFGWYLWLGDRVQVRTRAGTTRMRPHIGRSFDEHCNHAAVVHCWPLGQVTVWWEPHLRVAKDGPCNDCRAENLANGCCEWCGSRPCNCPEERPTRLVQPLVRLQEPPEWPRWGSAADTVCEHASEAEARSYEANTSTVHRWPSGPWITDAGEVWEGDESLGRLQVEIFELRNRLDRLLRPFAR